METVSNEPEYKLEFEQSFPWRISIRKGNDVLFDVDRCAHSSKDQTLDDLVTGRNWPVKDREWVVKMNQFQIQELEFIVLACNNHAALVDHLRWINNIIGTACDGGEAWCSVRGRKGASEWAQGMKSLMASLGYPATRPKE